VTSGLLVADLVVLPANPGRAMLEGCRFGAAVLAILEGRVE